MSSRPARLLSKTVCLQEKKKARRGVRKKGKEEEGKLGNGRETGAGG